MNSYLTMVGFVVLGLAAGSLGGIVGIGGGIILVPALVLIFGFDQHMAQGTSLAALIPPVGILAAMVYYRNGHINLSAATAIALGFLIGGLVGARFAQNLSQEVLQRVMGCLLLLLGTRLLFF